MNAQDRGCPKGAAKAQAPVGPCGCHLADNFHVSAQMSQKYKMQSNTSSLDKAFRARSNLMKLRNTPRGTRYPTHTKRKGGRGFKFALSEQKPILRSMLTRLGGALGRPKNGGFYKLTSVVPLL